ncbi:autotransporter outer membrane beta-barrel domain-containing protein [Luteibacter sp. 3190]|uniref:autotransporter outer membrane beta-barrel domain-containing protein n=1 Tax=Luteibacter sp. 3190 TaxID=2817736 RepID=UPI002861F9C4|nr:autotransporter outer membrane beta-barrel domain-containing protein [Luteibacter sp. 3190]MDR6937270.1 outer membrane autotransporter protein [Luteibacter sp. 3190]
MAIRSRGRNVLALAILCGIAPPGHAAQFTRGVVVERGHAEQFLPGDVIAVADPGSIALRIGARATVDGEGLSIRHGGAGDATRRSHGIVAVDGAELALSTSSVSMRAPRSTGLQVQRDASAWLDTVRIDIGADHGTALALSGGSARLDRSVLDAGRGHAIDTRFSNGGTATVTMRDSAAHGHIETGDVGFVLRAVDSTLAGDMIRSGAGMLDVSLSGSTWRGAAHGPTSFALERGTWTMTADSGIDTVRVGPEGRVALARPGAFGTLRAGTWHADPGAALVLRTRLDAGGTLARQGSDRLLVTGDVDGTTAVEIVHTGGAGANTARPRGPNGASDGISIVQVGGHATADAFRLAGDHVAVGPWRYQLDAYAPDVSDPSQRLVAGEGGFWDFRLQSTRVDRHGRMPGQDALRGGVPDRAALMAQVPAYLVHDHALMGFGRAAIDALQAEDTDEAREPALRARAFGGDSRYRSSLGFVDYGVDYARTDRGLQLLMDTPVAGTDGNVLRMGGGLLAGKSFARTAAAEGRASASTSVAGLALFTRLSTDGGWRLAGGLMATRYVTAVSAPGRGETLPARRAHGLDTSLSLAWRWQLGTHAVLEPGAAWLSQWLSTHGATDRDGIVVAPTSARRAVSRIGARASMPFAPEGRTLYAWETYLDVRYEAASDRGASATLSGERFATGRAGAATVASLGLRAELWSRTSVWLEASRRTRSGRAGEAGLRAAAGVSVVF